jgi:acetyl esterase
MIDSTFDDEYVRKFEEQRRSYRAMIPLAGPPDAVKEVRNLLFRADNPVRNIPLRIYFPLLSAPPEALPLFLFIHGGGCVSGDLDTHDVLARAIANKAGCIVISVAYRLASESPFPAGLEDCYAALVWCGANAAALGGDGSTIIVSGDSAGGNLAAVLAILSRDRGGPTISGQWLMYPTVSNKQDTKSWARLGSRYFPTHQVQDAVVKAYTPEGESPYSPLIAPLWADLDNLPPALIQVGGLDPLQDECQALAQKMQDHGTESTFILYPGQQHGFLQFYKDSKNHPGAEQPFNEGIAWLRTVFAKSLEPHFGVSRRHL